MCTRRARRPPGEASSGSGCCPTIRRSRAPAPALGVQPDAGARLARASRRSTCRGGPTTPSTPSRAGHRCAPPTSAPSSGAPARARCGCHDGSVRCTRSSTTSSSGEMIQDRAGAARRGATLDIVEPDAVRCAPASARPRRATVGSTSRVRRPHRCGRWRVRPHRVDGRAREACLVGGAPPPRRRRDRRVRQHAAPPLPRARSPAPPWCEQTYRGLTPTLPYPDQTSVLRHA